MSVLAAIAVLALLILVHELGHFAAARLQNIRVSRFSLGFGPVLFKYQGKETEYGIRAIPLGGYVGFPDDDPDSEIPGDDPDLLRNRPIMDRAIVISAGVIANLIFAYFLLIGQVTTVGIQDLQPGLLVPRVDQNSAAIVAGMKPGDVILGLAGQPLPSYPDASTTFINTIKKSANKPIEITLKRGSEQLNLSLTPTLNEEGQGKIGVALLPNLNIRRATTIGEALRYSSDAYERIVKLTVQGFWQLISHFQETAKQVAGPIKIVEYGANIASNDMGNLFQFAALISINLAVINILPLPALDGGQLVFLLIEGLLGKPLPNKIQEGVMQTGLVLLLGLGVVLIVRDTLNLAVFQTLFQ